MKTSNQEITIPAANSHYAVYKSETFASEAQVKKYKVGSFGQSLDSTHGKQKYMDCYSYEGKLIADLGFDKAKNRFIKLLGHNRPV